MKYYKSNRIVKLGDSIMVKFCNPNKKAKVSLIIYPDTKDSTEWSAPNGGAVIEFEDGSIILCMSSGPDEDIVFLNRDTIKKD